MNLTRHGVPRGARSFAKAAAVGGLALLGSMIGAPRAHAVSGAAFTTINESVDGSGADVCKNTAINCNIYGAKEYVWLNGGPAANGLGPDGEYFFAVLVPGGQPDPNDGGPKNLSDDYDTYLNRTFTVTDGEVSDYTGNPEGGETPHDFDSGVASAAKAGPKAKSGPDGLPPLIRLFPYADTTNPGGVYILAICSLEDGYPVEPRDCKYDAFKVKKGKMDFSFYLSGMKLEDLHADMVKDATDPGLPNWTILLSGMGPDGQPVDEMILTDENGFWEYQSPVYTFNGKDQASPVMLTVCEVLEPGWTQSFPGTTTGCYVLDFEVTGFVSYFDLDFGNWMPASVTGCKVQDLDGDDATTDDQVAVPGWTIVLTQEGVEIDSALTEADGCVTFSGLTPGFTYDVHEAEPPGWYALNGADYVFPDPAWSRGSQSHTFVNAVFQGCTPGFWQGGSDSNAGAGGQWLWNEPNDPQWTASGGQGTNPYVWTTLFNDFFSPVASLNGLTMMDLVGTGGGSEDARKAARSIVAAYLNASWGVNYPYDTGELLGMWAAAAGPDGDFLGLHLILDAANNAYDREGGGPHCPISASGF